jgi:N-carbamoylputrescine amidase
MPTVPLALTQMPCTDNPQANLAAQQRLIEEAAGRGARIICTQELCLSQYFCQAEDYRFFALAQSIPGPATETFCALAKRHAVVIVAGLFEKRTDGLYHNSAVIIDADGKMLGVYRKMHIPDDPLYYEKFYFTPGDTGFASWNTAYARVGVLICWDQWFPEAARLTALRGAQILLYPTAIGWHAAEKSRLGASQHDAWELMQRSHAVANGCWVGAANRVGREIITDAAGKPVHPDGIEFWGQSFIAAPDGTVAQRASEAGTEVVLAPCDLDAVDWSRTHWPFLRDRRIDAYADLSRRYVDGAKTP